MKCRGFVLNQKFIVVSKETLGRVIVLVDEAQKLSESLENNNQETRILLHSLVSDSRKGRKLSGPVGLLGSPKKKKGSV